MKEVKCYCGEKFNPGEKFSMLHDGHNYEFITTIYECKFCIKEYYRELFFHESQQWKTM